MFNNVIKASNQFDIYVRIQNVVINPTNFKYIVWTYLISILSTISAFFFPLGVAYDFENLGKGYIYMMITTECFIFINIINSFFVTYK